MADQSQTLGQLFSAKYDDPGSDWGGGVSGPGSNPYYNLPYRCFLEAFLVNNHIESLVDIGCGDWQFSQYVRYAGLSYVGLDIVDSVVQRNNAMFGKPNVRFELMPEDKADTPGADLLVMKDVLQHLDDAEIMDFYRRVVPKYRYCLITNSYRKLDTPTNVDTASGGFRCLDLRAAPYDWKGGYVLQFTTAVWEEIRTLLVVN